jgi:hypothetical protein
VRVYDVNPRRAATVALEHGCVELGAEWPSAELTRRDLKASERVKWKVPFVVGALSAD